MTKSACTICVMAFGLAVTAARADMITFTAADASLGLAASATFQTSGSSLIVTLTNTSTDDVLVPADVLTALFFDSATSLSLTRVSAVLATGSTVFYDADGQPAGGVVGGEWAYKSGLSGAPYGAARGISSSGLSPLFGPGDIFPGPDLQSPVAPDGLQYGLLSAGDNTATGNGGITGSGGLIKNSVVFTLSGLPTGFSVRENIHNVSFQYGTALDEPNLHRDVPDSGMTLMLLGSALVGLETLRRRFLA